MSFVDLATLAIHRRHEMESRVNSFLGKCDQTINNIMKLKEKGRGVIHQMNCDPSELKDRFLKCTYQLEDYTYLITDIDLALVGKLGETGSTEYTPVHDTSVKCLTPITTAQPFNIMDVLSEPAPSTSTACRNLCPAEKPKKERRKISKEEQTLITFSSASCSSESMPKNELVDLNDNYSKKPEVNVKQEAVLKTEKHVQCELLDAFNRMDMTAPGPSSPGPSQNLPAQSILDQDATYPATIMSIDGASFWVVTDNTVDLCKLLTNMTSYYNEPANKGSLTPDQLSALTYCALYDGDTEFWYRGLFLQLNEEESTVEVFLVDTGEVRTSDATTVCQLAPQFFAVPPYARCCHLAGVEMLSCQQEDLVEKQDVFLKQYIATQCTVRIDDNSSESLGVYVTLLPENVCLNDLLVKEGLAHRTAADEQPTRASPARLTSTPSHGPPELSLITDSELEMLNMDCPEHEDPVEAVTGYSCRDEMDICKHYKGGPDKTCFKGSRCKKKHVMHHPDGWTLDKVEVVAKCESLPLPAPDTWLRAHVTCVLHFDRLYVQIVADEVEHERPTFGVVRTPSSLDALILDMNSPAQRMEYKPFKIAPAAGELVAAVYPFDNQYYRARVLNVTPADQNVEVMYIDFGNTIYIKEDKLSMLPERYAVLPAQAVLCRLAGVEARSSDSKQWAAAKKALSALVLDHTLDAHVISRDYDEITVELYDKNGVSIAEELAGLHMVTLSSFQVIDDTKMLHRLVVP